MAVLTWRKLLTISALIKAGVAGAGLMLAVFGAFDFAAAIFVQDWIAEQKALLSIDMAASLGAAAGVAWKLFNIATA